MIHVVQEVTLSLKEDKGFLLRAERDFRGVSGQEFEFP